MATSIVERYAYDLLDREIRYTDGEGAVTTRQYDLNGRISNIVPPNEHAKTAKNAALAVKGYSYTYDLDDRLLEVVGPDNTLLVRNSYDAQGNTINDGENTYLYDSLNRIAQVTTKAGDIQKNHYDVEGLRDQMEENGHLISFIYSERQLVVEEDENGEKIRYIRGHEVLASDSESARIYYHYASDEMGSITHITDEAGEVKNHYEYDAFGNTTEAQGSVTNRLGFCGEIRDAITGQYYLRARFYNPVVARFMNEDTYYGDGLKNSNVIRNPRCSLLMSRCRAI